MSGLGKLLSDDLEIGILNVKCEHALQTFFAGNTTRKHELHVSDFTKNDKNFCAPTVVVRYLRGEEGQRQGTWVQYDGKWREEKWKRIFEAAGMLRFYQKELRLGELVGHPDFYVDFGRGLRIVELTGSDLQQDIKLLGMRLAVKKRQLAMYLGMDISVDRGFVLQENKATQERKWFPIERDDETMKHLMARVKLVNGFVSSLTSVPATSHKEAFLHFVSQNRCGRKVCAVCVHGEAWGAMHENSGN